MFKTMSEVSSEGDCVKYFYFVTTFQKGVKHGKKFKNRWSENQVQLYFQTGSKCKTVCFVNIINTHTLTKTWYFCCFNYKYVLLFI